MPADTVLDAIHVSSYHYSHFQDGKTEPEDVHQAVCLPGPSWAVVPSLTAQTGSTGVKHGSSCRDLAHPWVEACQGQRGGPQWPQSLEGIVPTPSRITTTVPSLPFFSNEGFLPAAAPIFPARAAGRPGRLASGEKAELPLGVPSSPRRQKKDQVGIMKTMSHKAPKGICFHTLKTKDANSPLEPEWGNYCLEGVPGKRGEVSGVWTESPSKCPHLLDPLCSQSPVQIPAPPPQALAGEQRLMAKWPRSQTKHSECSQAPQTAGTKGRVRSEPTGPLVWEGALCLGGRQKPDVPICCVTLGRSCPLGLSFPVCTTKEQHQTLGL